MADMFPITIVDKLACAQRELGKRREVYPRLIDAGKLSREKADRETELMAAIVEDYARAAALGATMVSARLLRVGPRADGEPGAGLRLDVAVAIAGQEQPRLTTIDVAANAYALRATWLSTGRLIEHLRASGETAFLPDAQQATEAEAGICRQSDFMDRRTSA